MISEQLPNRVSSSVNAWIWIVQESLNHDRSKQIQQKLELEAEKRVETIFVEVIKEEALGD